MKTPDEISIYRKRRERLAEAMGAGVAVVPTAPERVRNRDAHYPYRFDSHFYYLSGFAEPDAVLVVVAGSAPKTFLFCRTKNLEREIWDGFRYGPEAARERFGFDAAFPIEELDDKLAGLLENQSALFYPVGDDPAWDARAMKWLNAVRARVRAGITAPDRVQDVRALIDDMRLVKDAHEQSLMRRAARIAAAAHRRAMQSTRPGRNEYEIEAELLYEFRRSGRFSAAQREVYELVLEAQKAAIAKVAPGAAWIAPHDAAVRVLAQGMIDLELVRGSLDEVLEKETYKRFYMHRTGHWLGLDVHDAGEYGRAGNWRALAPGMTLTVEPGLYIRAADDVPERLRDIGVRIEDDVLVTAAGCEVLSAEAPKSVADIEALMRDARPA